MAAAGTGQLLERELETEHLRRAVDHTFHGVGRVVVIEGPAGIGKTRLVGVSRELARGAGMNVRSARGAELEQSFGFGVVRQLFDSLLAGASEERRGEWLSGAAGLAAPLFDANAPVHEPTSRDSSYPRMHGLYWLCANLARKHPLALFVDDAQWADEPSLIFLGFLARRLEELPVLLVVAVRSRLAGIPDALGSLLTDTGARVIRLQGLSEDAVGRMLGTQLGQTAEEEFARTCHAATAGNPFLVHALVAELAAKGTEPVSANAPQVGSIAPEHVADAALRRLAQLGPAGPSMARALAILGDGTSVATVAALAGLSEREALDTAAAMRASELLGDEVGLAFAHPLIRAAIYKKVLRAERVGLHAEAARLLRSAGAPAEQVAAQILIADGVAEPWAIEELRKAAASAVARGAQRNAAAYLQRALELDPDPNGRAPTLAVLGQAAALAGLPEAPGYLEEAVRLTSDPRVRTRLAVGLAELLKWTGSGARAVELVSGLEPEPDRHLRDLLEVELLSGATVSHEAYVRLVPRLRELVDHGGPARTDRERFELALIALERVRENGSVATVLDLFARAGVDRGPGGVRIAQPPQIGFVIMLMAYYDLLDQAIAHADRGVERARGRGAFGGLAVNLSMRAEIALRRGDLGEALADASQAFELSKMVAASRPGLLQHPVAIMNDVAAERTRSDPELEQLLVRTDECLDRDTLHVGHALLARARLLLACGQVEAALAQQLAVGELPRAFGSGNPAVLAWRSQAALTMHQLGDQSGAKQLALDELELARAMGAGRAIGIALRAVALVQRQVALDDLRQAVAVLARSPARLEQARALVDLGAAMRRTGERSAAREPLRQGHAIAVRCGATLLAERAAREVAATGARVAQTGLRGAAALTPSELRVAERAAAGQSNRDIAQELFITEKTVETHLGHAYDKLGVRSRTKLHDVLATPGIHAA
jgi:DNA-binding NarL/FixJ family response regulator